MEWYQIVVSAVVGISALIQVSPIQINPWSRMARWIGREINGELEKKVDCLKRDVLNLRYEFEEQNAVLCRARIIVFGDEILHGREHSKEHFDQILLDISNYKSYCDSHPNFRNDVATLTIARIESVYKDRLKKNDFL